jgi:hypothetical protein
MTHGKFILPISDENNGRVFWDLSKKNINVGYEPFFTVTQERRGGSRCGLDKF